MNCLLVAAGDLFLYKLAAVHFDELTAKLSLVMFLFNKQSILIFGSTLTNGVEGIMAVIGLYFFARVFNNKERKLDMVHKRNEVYAMTFAITLAFLVRSSSLVGWIPLALVAILSHRDNFMAIVEAGVYVTVPLVLFSIAIDSFFYGRLTCPQFNFVYINVVEDIAKNFGTHPADFYVWEIQEFVIAFRPLFPLALGSFLFMTFRGLSFDRMILGLFVATNFIVLSLLKHKEMRFLAMVLPIFVISIAWSLRSISEYSATLGKIVFYIVVTLEVLLLEQVSLNFTNGWT